LRLVRKTGLTGPCMQQPRGGLEVGDGHGDGCEVFN